MRWIHFILFIGILVLVTRLLGLYIHAVLNPHGKTWFDPILKPLENFTYRFCKIEPFQEQTAKQYLASIFVFSSISLLVTLGLLAVQHHLPLNPQKMGPIPFDLNLNTSISFMTNTDWQSYGGESTMSYFSQMVPLTLQNFLSPIVGISSVVALVRAIKRNATVMVGNFFVDLIRLAYYLFLPACFFLALFFIYEGVPQNFKPYTLATTLEGKVKQLIVQGPIASQEAVKLFGTNGGGYTRVNSAHPFENPTPLSNFVQMLTILAIPSSLIYYFGKKIKNLRHGWNIFVVVLVSFLIGFILCFSFENRGFNAGIEKINMEGKEARFGVFASSLYATVTTAVASGSVNSSHTSFSPIGGLIPMINMQLGEAIFGGAGAGLFTIILFIILAVFLCGLIIGKTPEYLSKKIEARDIKICLISLLAFMFIVLVMTSVAINIFGLSEFSSKGPHGFSEVLYAYSSAAANNGSSFASLQANTPFYNYTLAFTMLVGRIIIIVPTLLLAGSFVRKKKAPPSTFAFPISGGIFIILLLATILLVGVLTFLPALTIGPVFEEFLMRDGALF